MSEIVFLIASIFIILDSIGFIISVEFYILFRENRKYLRFFIGWIFWILSYILILISTFIINELIDVFVVISSTMAEFSISMAFLSYFREVELKIFLGLIAFFILMPIISYLLGFYDIIINLFSFMRFVIIFTLIAIPFIKEWKFKELLTIGTFRLYLIFSTILIVFLVNYLILSIQGYRLYSDEYNLSIFLFYLTLFIVKSLIVVLQIHFEYDMLNYIRYQLKDKYSHELGNIMQSITMANQLIEKFDVSDEVNDLNKLINDKSNDASKIIKEIRKI